MSTTLPKLIAIVGPTASGKTSLSLQLAKQFSGEIISADSRQLYRGMDIGTAKEPNDSPDTDEYRVSGIAHYGIDICTPDEEYTVALFQRYAYDVINQIIGRGNIPFLVGGSSLYCSAIIDGYNIATVKPNQELRAQLAACSTDELITKLRAVDPHRLEQIGEHNRRYLIRALEVAAQGSDPSSHTKTPQYESCILAPDISRDELYARINQRVDQMMVNGLVKETQRLCNQYGAHLPAMSSIGYAEIGAYLDGDVSEEEAVSQIKKRTRQFAKRQLTWWRKDDRVQWVSGVEQAMSIVGQFL